MKLEDIVCTREQADRLKAAGWTKKTVFYWEKIGDWRIVQSCQLEIGSERLSAPCLSELTKNWKR